jgi:hypothetical protein
MTAKSLSPKMLLHRANTSKSAMGFIQQYREYMVSGELADLLSPIVARVDAGSLMPTPAKDEIARATLEHIVACALVKLEEGRDKLMKGETHSSTKRWQASVVDANDVIQTYINEDGEVKDLIKSGDDVSTLDRWLDRKLFEGSSEWHGIIEHSVMQVRTIVERSDAIARILRQPKSAVSRQQSKSAGRLSFGMQVRNDHSHFSHG